MDFYSKLKVACEQLAPGHWTVVLCLWCRQPGASDPHHWLVKKNGNIPDEIADLPINVVLLCRACHDRHGQSKELTTRCWGHKEALGYDPRAWLKELETRGLIKTASDYFERS